MNEAAAGGQFSPSPAGHGPRHDSSATPNQFHSSGNVCPITITSGMTTHGASLAISAQSNDTFPAVVPAIRLKTSLASTETNVVTTAMPMATNDSVAVNWNHGRGWNGRLEIATKRRIALNPRP